QPTSSVNAVSIGTLAPSRFACRDRRITQSKGPLLSDAMTPEHYGSTVGAATGVNGVPGPDDRPEYGHRRKLLPPPGRQPRRGRRDLQPPDGHIALVCPGPGVRWNRVLIASR